jgi:hypothetical protein
MQIAGRALDFRVEGQSKQETSMKQTANSLRLQGYRTDQARSQHEADRNQSSLAENSGLCRK